MAYYLSGGHKETLAAAAEVLQSGGNAFDAAIAAFTTSFVTEPAMSSAGGGGFALCKKSGEEAQAFNFFSATPKHKPQIENINIQPVEVHFGDEMETYYADMGSIAVPGAVRGIFALHRAHGTMPIAELFHHAIKCARKGVELNSFQNLDLNLLKNIFKRSSYANQYFFDSQENIKAIGEIIRVPALADFLEVLSIEGPDLFYRGEVGQQLVADCAMNGGVIDMDSLSTYQAIISTPLSTNYGTNTIYTMPYPSLGGPLFLWLAKEQQNRKWDEFRSETYMRHMSEILIEGRRLQDNPEELYAHFGLTFPPGDNRRGSTSHFNILDKDQNAVSLTMTIGEGSGYFIPGTGVHMNNMLGEPGLLPSGINSWTPNTQMRSMMTPTMVVNQDGMPELIMGTGGAVRIPFMLAQVMNNLSESDCSLAEAVDLPRLFFDGSQLHIESAGDIHFPDLEVLYNEWNDFSLFFGGVNAIGRIGLTDEYMAYGDFRRDGEAIVSRK